MNCHHLHGALNSPLQELNMHLNSPARDKQLPTTHADVTKATNNLPV